MHHLPHEENLREINKLQQDEASIYHGKVGRDFPKIQRKIHMSSWSSLMRTWRSGGTGVRSRLSAACLPSKGSLGGPPGKPSSAQNVARHLPHLSPPKITAARSRSLLMCLM